MPTIISIADPADPRIEAYRDIRERDLVRRDGLFVAEGKVVLDANHPLAGMALKFSCTVVDVRPANEGEIASGSADDASPVIVRALP